MREIKLEHDMIVLLENETIALPIGIPADGNDLTIIMGHDVTRTAITVGSRAGKSVDHLAHSPQQRLEVRPSVTEHMPPRPACRPPSWDGEQRFPDRPTRLHLAWPTVRS